MKIEACGNGIAVGPGAGDVAGAPVRLEQTTTLAITPAPVHDVVDEPLNLSPDRPEGFSSGTRLRGLAVPGPNGPAVTPRNCLAPGSVVVRAEQGGDELCLGRDYLLSELHGMLGVAPGSRVTSDDTVYVSYRYSQMRVDAVDLTPNGSVLLTEGTPHVTIPRPPDPVAASRRLAHIFRPYHAKTVETDHVYPIEETAAQAVTGTTPGRIPRALAKLRAGEPLTIVCWGDSVTQGGDASALESRYVNVFEAGLRERFPQAALTIHNVSVGGSNSRQWLYPERLDNPSVERRAQLAFDRVLEPCPDLVTIEFVNDVSMDAETVKATYSDILQRLHGIDAECILITPHFTHPAWMGFTSMREAENRVYVEALRQFADDNGVALADASARWGHLWKEGLPYLTLLRNRLNHPEDRGHRLFAEELWKCFR